MQVASPLLVDYGHFLPLIKLAVVARAAYTAPWYSRLRGAAMSAAENDKREVASGDPGQTSSNRIAPARSRVELVCWVAAAVLIAGLIYALLPRIGGPRGAGKRDECRDNLRMIGRALYQYHNDHGCVPPAYFADAAGEPIHSWRALLLPYLDEELARQYRFDEPWDGPHNQALHDRIARQFRCPSDKSPKNDTSYVVVIGPQTLWPGSETRRLASVTDGLSNTIAIVEVANSGINWLQPRDFTVAELQAVMHPVEKAAGSTNHSGGRLVLMADSSVQFVHDRISREQLDALLTIDGREPITQ